MKSRAFKLLLTTLLPATLGLWGCSGGSDAELAQQAFDSTTTAGTLPEGHPEVAGGAAADGSGAVAGISWQVPIAWEAGGQRSMRVATYVIPAVESDPEPAECAVFYFGTSQGGEVQANVDRWIGQFEQADGSSSADLAKTTTLDVNGLPVTLVEVKGIYTASMGPMSGGSVRKEGFQMQGAIVEGPEGAVFFKLTGPEKTVEQARAGFDVLVRSVTTL